jgi:hypothetical protein
MLKQDSPFGYESEFPSLAADNWTTVSTKRQYKGHNVMKSTNICLSQITSCENKYSILTACNNDPLCFWNGNSDQGEIIFLFDSSFPFFFLFGRDEFVF